LRANVRVALVPKALLQMRWFRWTMSMAIAGVTERALSRAAAGVGCRCGRWCGPAGRHGLIPGYGGDDDRAIGQGIRGLARCL
jgi:hypothetical protein